MRYRNALRTVSCAAALLLMAAPLAMGGPKDDLDAAVQKLDDASSYSWKTTNSGGMFSSTSEGKTQKGVATMYTMHVGQNSTQVLKVGDQSAINTGEGWQSVSDAEGAQGPGRFAAGMARNAQTPGEAAKMFSGDVTQVTKNDDGSYSADLSDAVTKRMMAMRGRGGPGGPNGAPQPQFNNMKGAGKFWIGSDGTLSKVEVHITGSVSFNGQDMDLDRTVTTEISDVNSTTVDVPAEAKAKLSGGGAATQPGM